MLVGGFALWRTHPRLMLWGLLPAVIAALVLVLLLIPFGFALGPLTAWLTPFAEGWDPVWRMLLRGTIGIVLFISAAALSAALFTALALIIGDPFYQRIWKAVEADSGGVPTDHRGGRAATLRDSARLVLFGMRNALIVLVVGFLPAVGGALAAALGAALSARLLARELSGRAFEARGIAQRERGRVLRASRARVLGFGLATQLCFLVPFGAILTMPAAVAGATRLVRGLLDERVDPSSSQRTSGDA